MNLKREQLAWAAGFFDGEGSIHSANSKLKKTYPNVGITQVGAHGRELLERFQNAVGGIGKIYGPYKKTIAGNPRYQWETWGFEKSQAVIAMLWEFLGPVKRAKAKKILLASR